MQSNSTQKPSLTRGAFLDRIGKSGLTQEKAAKLMDVRPSLLSTILNSLEGGTYHNKLVDFMNQLESNVA
jgi:hypothetical protein